MSTKEPIADVPSIDESVFVAPNATVIGRVTIGGESSVWYGAVIRGDVDAIRIGRQTNGQDLCVLHADEGLPCTLGDRVTVGHSAIIHGAVIEDEVLIGMRAVVMNGVRVGTGSVIAAGAVITEGTAIPPGSVVMGMPARVVRSGTEQDHAQIRLGAQHYVDVARQHARLHARATQ